jgi:hypothetical protein
MSTADLDKSVTSAVAAPAAVKVPRVKKQAAKRKAAQGQSGETQREKKRAVKSAKTKDSTKGKKVMAAKQVKQKLVRDSFTIPEVEYQILVNTKKLLTKSGVEVKKTELIRVGLLLIQNSSLSVLKRQLSSLSKLKSGRPKKSK